MKSYFLAIFLFVSYMFTSCITNKDIVYLQEAGTANPGPLALIALPKPYRIQTNDVLSINVKAIDPELVGIFNPANNADNTGETQAGLYFNGFTVDAHGNIEFPILGEINVLGYTLDEIEVKVKRELIKQYFKETAEIFVTAKLPGLRYTLTGEANSGVYTLYQDRVNIIEALANTGDLPVTANRKDVLIIRQYTGGQKIHHIDLTSIKAVESPYYFIQPNDIILVKPLKRKAWGAGQTIIENITTVASILSVLVSTYFLTRNL